MITNFYGTNDFFDKYEMQATNSGHTVNFALVRNETQIYVYKTVINYKLADTALYLEKLIKTLLYIVGCGKILTDDKFCADILNELFSKNGKRSFDYAFFSKAFNTNFEIKYTEKLPRPCWEFPKLGGKQKGKRIGLDAGGSDIKICAVKDGKAIYSEEIIWLPKLNDNPSYHYDYIKNAIEKAHNILGGADSLGISTAGVVADNEVRIASLFIKVPDKLFDKKVKNIYKGIAEEFSLPLIVANDGDVAAYSGALELNTDSLLGIAMGTSEAGGYVDNNRNINGFLNELAFIPINIHPEAFIDEWSGDIGCGAKYLSQDAVIKLAKINGIEIENELTLAEKLKYIQCLAENKDKRAIDVFNDIGVFLGEAITFYSRFYSIKTVMLMGRVTSGTGGEILVRSAKMRLLEKNMAINLVIPNEHSRRLGQAYAAALL